MPGPSLFSDSGNSAVFSDCGRYRYKLTRIWDEHKPPLVYVCLNPSTADAETDDNTIMSCCRIARHLGFGGIVVVNIFAWRSTDPAGLKDAEDPVGPENDKHLAEATDGRVVVAAWGVNGKHLSRGNRVIDLLIGLGRDLRCFKVTRDGYPIHPLYLKTESELIPYGR